MKALHSKWAAPTSRDGNTASVEHRNTQTPTANAVPQTQTMPLAGDMEIRNDALYNLRSELHWHRALRDASAGLHERCSSETHCRARSEHWGFVTKVRLSSYIVGKRIITSGAQTALVRSLGKLPLEDRDVHQEKTSSAILL